MNPKLALHLPIMGQMADSFTVYGVERSTAEKIELASQVKGLDGLEMVYPFEFEDVEEVKRLLKAYDLECATVNVNVKAEAKFHRGSFTSPDPEVRAEAVRYLKEGMDVAAAMGCYIATVCPLADGHDYPFEVDYRQAWKWLREGIAEAAQYRSDVKVSLEYKSSEVRTHVVPSRAGVALHLCHQIGLSNLGITLDFGHALVAGETPAQVVALLAEAGRLFLIHISDNYRDSDWEMVPGTVNFWDLLETLLYLDEVGYEGWIVADGFHTRLDPVKAADLALKTVQTDLLLLKKIGVEELWRLIRAGDVPDTFTYVQDKLLDS